MQAHLKGTAFALASSAAFGLLPAVTLPLMERGMNALSILFYRFLASALLVGLHLAVTRTRFVVERRQWRDLGLFACLPYAGCALCLFLSYSHIASGVATTLHFLYPVIVAAVMALAFGERWRPLLWIGMGLSIAGVAVLSLSGSGGGGLSAIGLAEVLLSSVLYAVYIVGVNRSSLSALRGLPLCFLVFSGSALIFAVYGLMTGQLQAPSGSGALAYIAAGALVPTLCSNLCLLRALHLIGSTTTSVLGCLESLTAVGVGVLFFGEPMSPRIALGIGIVLAAVVWVICFSGERAGAVRSRAAADAPRRPDVALREE